MTHYIFGDTGGHYDALQAGLLAVGVDPETSAVPLGDTVVSVGDFIHKGPQSAETLRLVDRLLRNNEGRFICLIGNHEMLHFSGMVARNSGYCKCTDEDVDILNTLKDDGLLQYAYAFESDSEKYLVTHAGLTKGFWSQKLSEETDVFNAADIINDLSLEVMNELSYLKTGFRSFEATPVWAVCDSEVAQSWIESGTDMPFHMIHGHTTLLNWDDNSWYGWILEHNEILSRTVMDFRNRFQIIHLGDKKLIGVDPTYWYDKLPEGTVQPHMSFG